MKRCVCSYVTIVGKETNEDVHSALMTGEGLLRSTQQTLISLLNSLNQRNYQSLIFFLFLNLNSRFPLRLLETLVLGRLGSLSHCGLIWHKEWNWCARADLHVKKKSGGWGLGGGRRGVIRRTFPQNPRTRGKEKKTSHMTKHG